MSRTNVFGPNSLYSFTKFGALNRSNGVVLSKRMKDTFRLENQKHMRKDFDRERRYRLCQRCGITSVTVNFDQVPSARVGLWGRCVDGKDYTHHRFVELSQREYEQLRDWPIEKRLNWWRYEGDE
ncbi:conserved hypothetical protein [Leishmania major strain Friedlin]|uniref:Uncharacterized protein n=1 Tax=Leishmania major TaxID=5664 RepID=Q4QA59_LEIMA|nr:conserved hypothetical protein [Leishmania major strain Friedlin]CAG9575045.1 hypothetical_protein_-_conserved [Leishmania major strain Friedlin]CAJ04632.1 conserved hypothetical protein [Leishmania major strain Friedlin]|eukprot:XP_001683789.1 conserved hypothetical protein [Leishmania major strain Friedlin]